MSKNTSILLDDHFADRKKDDIIEELKKGERSGFVTDFDGDIFLNGLHLKHGRKGCLKVSRASSAPRS